jgi:hypothetical protein
MILASIGEVICIGPDPGQNDFWTYAIEEPHSKSRGFKVENIFRNKFPAKTERIQINGYHILIRTRDFHGL